EIDEYVAAGGRVARDGVGPPRHVVRGVALVAQAEVGVVRGDLDRRRQLLAVGDAQREIARSQPPEHLVIEPGDIAELERRGYLRRQVAEKGVEQRQILLQVRRQLKQKCAELCPKVCGR